MKMRRQSFGQPDGRDRTDPGPDEGANELTCSATSKHQRKRKTNCRQARALHCQHERKEGEKCHARGAIDHANR